MLFRKNCRVRNSVRLKQSMSDRRSKDRQSPILPKDRVAIGDRKINDRDHKKRDLFSDLLDIHFGSDFTRIFQVTLNFFTISKKAGKKVFNLLFSELLPQYLMKLT